MYSSIVSGWCERAGRIEGQESKFMGVCLAKVMKTRVQDSASTAALKMS